MTKLKIWGKKHKEGQKSKRDRYRGTKMRKRQRIRIRQEGEKGTDRVKTAKRVKERMNKAPDFRLFIFCLVSSRSRFRHLVAWRLCVVAVLWHVISHGHFGFSCDRGFSHVRGCTHQRSQGSPVAREDVLISVLRWKKELDREAKSMCGFTSVANLSSSQA